MVRGRRLPAVLALLALVATGCGRLTQAVGLSTPGGPPDPANAIALSILDQSIYLVDPNSGRSEAIVPNLTSFQSGYASWAPNHRSLAYGNGGVHIFNPATAKSVQLVPGQTVSMPAWSPKGKAIVYGSGVSSWVTPVANPTPLQITFPQDLSGFGFDWIGGGGIAFQGMHLDCTNAEGCIATSESDIWTVRADGTGLTQVTVTRDALNPKWSKDGSKLLYVRASSQKGFGSQLWVINADGTSPQRLISAKNVVAADWSPDGRDLVVVRSIGLTNALQVWVGNADGSGLQQIGAPYLGTDATVDW